jgi:Family of unknown function (DUF5675)
VNITLTRFCYAPTGTFGRIILASDAGMVSLFTVERPWLKNQPDTSCIPEGIYPIELLPSDLIKRITYGKYTSDWHVQSVPGRTNIEMHPGNTMYDVEGCIAMGLNLGMLSSPSGAIWAVLASQQAFQQFMTAMGTDQTGTLTIEQYKP